MTIYEELQSVASDLFKEFKQDVITLIKVTPGGGPAQNPGVSTEFGYALDAVARGPKYKYIQAGLATKSDVQINHAVHPTVTPDPQDFIIVGGSLDATTGIVTGGRRFKITEIMPIPAAGTPVAYSLIVKR